MVLGFFFIKKFPLAFDTWPLDAGGGAIIIVKSRYRPLVVLLDNIWNTQLNASSVSEFNHLNLKND